MHQEHNIPWNTLAANLSYIHQNPRFTPRRTDLFSRNRPTQGPELNHFVRKLANTIQTFSETERNKFPAPRQLKSECSSFGKLFQDDLRDRYSGFLNSDNQLIENWISRARTNNGGYSYSTSQGDLADVVKILISENVLQPLLMLAHHEQIPLPHLHHLSWGHHFGFSRIAESALVAYIFFNVVAAAELLGNGKYTEMMSYSSVVSLVTASMDYDGQQLPHRSFFQSCRREPAQSPSVHDDLSRLREYLKTLFRMLYHYDMVVRECGKDPKWEEEIIMWIKWLWSIPTQTDYDPVEERYTTKFI